MTDFLLTIKILTRDNPTKLKSCLRYLNNDLKKLNSKVAIALIDDSADSKNRRKNKELFVRTFSKSGQSMYYLSKEEYSYVLKKSPSRIKKKILSLIGMMGSKKYKPSRVKNASQLIDINSDFHLLLDDDVIIKNDKEANNSIIVNSLINARQNNSIVSVHLKGFLDLSLIQILERSIIKAENKLHEWNEDISPFGLSGGFLLYPHDNDSLFFPDLYDEDYLWVAYSSTKKNIGSLQLNSNVFHKPARKKIFSLDGLTFQGIGEITYLSLADKTSLIDNFVTNKKFPEQDVIRGVIDEYCEYLEYLIDLIRKKNRSKILNSPYLEQIPIVNCDQILNKHLKNVKKISYQIIQKNYQDWTDQQDEWLDVEPIFSNYIMKATKI